jgi:hypothetical protein
MSGLSNKKFSEVAEIYSGIMLNENQNQLPGSSGSNPKPPRNFDPRTSFRSGVKSSFGLDPAKPTMSQIGGKMKGYAGRAVGGGLRFGVEVAKMPLRVLRGTLKNRWVQGVTALGTGALGADALIRGDQSVLGQMNPFKRSDLNQYQSFEMSGEPLSEEVLVEVHNEIWSYVVTKLVEEKYAPDVEAAQKMAEHISDDWFFTLIDENSIMEELNV